jgi:hypothetical protein
MLTPVPEILTRGNLVRQTHVQMGMSSGISATECLKSFETEESLFSACSVSCGVLHSVQDLTEEAAFAAFVNGLNMCETLMGYSKLVEFFETTKGCPSYTFIASYL